MKKAGLLTLLFFIFVSLAPLSALADGTADNVTIRKTILHPKTNTYVKSLNAAYKPGDTITFHITLTNTGKETVPQIIVRDIFPKHITFVSGAGSFDEKNSMLSFLVYNLKPGTSQSFAISTKVAEANTLPKNQPELCAANKVTMLLGKNQRAEDQTQFCIALTGNAQRQPVQNTPQQQQVYPPITTNQTPSTGVPFWILPSLIAAGISGSVLITKTKYRK